MLTEKPAALPPPLEAHEFVTSYRERLEYKLHHKLSQITRTERLLENLPEEQKPAFEALLAEERNQRAEIQLELDQLYRLLDNIKPNETNPK